MLIALTAMQYYPWNDNVRIKKRRAEYQALKIG